MKVILFAVVIWCLIACSSGPKGNSNVNSNIATSPPSAEENRKTGEQTAESFMNDPKTAEALGTFPVKYFRHIDSTGGQDKEAIGNNIRAIDQNVSYWHLVKDIESYLGQPWGCTGRVLTIEETEGSDGGRITQAFIAIEGPEERVVFARGKFATKFIKNDRVYAIGYIGGRRSIELPDGRKVSFPGIAARALLEPDEAARLRAAKQ